MDEQKIRQIVQQELQRSNNASRFAVNSIPQHTHDGVNSPQVKEENIIPAVSIVGNVEFAQVATYRINLNSSFTPRQILVNGIVVGTYSSVALRSSFSGIAQLTPTFYLQPSDNTTSVITGNIEYPFNGVPAQNSSALTVFRGDVDFGGTIGTLRPPVFANSSEFHICSIQFPTTSLVADIHARATVTAFSREFIEIDVPYLDSGWSIFINLTIT